VGVSIDQCVQRDL